MYFVPSDLHFFKNILFGNSMYAAILKELILVAENGKNRSEKLLLNILPIEVADELIDRGFVKPVLFENVNILFTNSPYARE